MLTADKDADIRLIYEWLRREMAAVGCRNRIKFPKRTPRQKTYLYRDLELFHAQIVEKLDLNHSQTQDIIRIAVQYGRDRKILVRGAKLLHMKDLLAICQKWIEQRRSFEDNMLRAIKHAKEHLDRHRLNSVLAMSSPNNIGGFSNLYQMVESGIMPIEYLALSKTASRALAALPAHERERMPSDAKLAILRINLTVKGDRVENLAEILGSDLYLTSLGGNRVRT
jgi:hypothetical protein